MPETNTHIKLTILQFKKKEAHGVPTVVQQMKCPVLSLWQLGFNPWPGAVGWGSALLQL